jgi:hypothetical protein
VETIACGKRSLGRGTVEKEIQVHADIKTPSFYLRGDRNEVLFFQRNDVLARASQRADEYRRQGLDQAAERSERLLKELEPSQSPSDYADLFRYALRSSDFGLELNALAADLLSDGKAAVMQGTLAGGLGKPMPSIRMYFRLNQQHDPVAKWFCTLAGSSLLRITYYVD